MLEKWNELNGQDWFPRAVPFAVFMAFIMLESSLSGYVYQIYIVKTIVVGSLLLLFKDRYTELKWSAPIKDILTALIFGLVVFVLWINMTWDFAVIGKLRSENPFEKVSGNLLYPALFFRIFGASIIVPVMEELFWRSFVIRWIDNNNFLSVPLGTFTMRSFIITVLLFGSEHTLWLAGIMAGVIYNILLYLRKDLWLCIIAHAVTNFILAVYVLSTNRWIFW